MEKVFRETVSERLDHVPMLSEPDNTFKREAADPGRGAAAVCGTVPDSRAGCVLALASIGIDWGQALPNPQLPALQPRAF
jgi:hypothetical protein